MKRLFLFFTLIISGAGCLSAEEEAFYQARADTLFHVLLDAQATEDYDAFVKNGTLEFKVALTKTQFEASSDLMISRMKSGYTLDSLGELNQRGYAVYLYRLRFKDGGDDILAKLSMKNGQMAGIFFK